MGMLGFLSHSVLPFVVGDDYECRGHHASLCDITSKGILTSDVFMSPKGVFQEVILPVGVLETSRESLATGFVELILGRVM